MNTLRERLDSLEYQIKEIRRLYVAMDPTSVTPTIQSVYGKPLSELKCPEGFRFTGELRKALPGETFLEIDGLLSQQTVSGDLTTGPRLILRKCKRLVFDIVDENRVPKSGEWAHIPTETVAVVRGIWKEKALYILSEPRVEE
jgi:hypothetical protein